MLPALAIIFYVKQRFPFCMAGGGQRLVKAEGDKLSDTGRVEMRQMSARVPAKETAGASVIVERFGPGAFASD